MSEVPDWIVPGRPVSVETWTEKSGRTAVRTWMVSRVGKRYVIVSDAMGNEQKFQTSTLSRSGSGGRTETLISPDRMKE